MVSALPRAFRPTLGLLVLAAAVHSAWLVVGWGGADHREWYSDLHYLLVAGLFLVVVGQLFARGRGPLRVALGWLLAHALVRFAAEGSWAYLELVVRVPPFPSFADGLYFLAYLLQGVAFLLLARLPLLGLGTARLALDSLIVVGAVGVFSWQLFLGSVAGNAAEPLVARLVSLGYPALDLVLLSLLLLAVFRNQRLRAHEVLFSLGLGLSIVGDYLFAYLSQTDAYVTGGMIDALWAWSFVLEGLGAVLALSARTRPRAPRRAAVWQVNLTLLAPYLALAASFVLLLGLYGQRAPALGGVLWGTAVITLLVTVRQVVLFTDNARLHRALTAREAQLEHLAHHDPLTELPNRRALTAHLAEAVGQARAAGTRLALLFVDLDGFKHINDTHGHAAGDTALREIAGRLRAHAPEGAQVARLSGDEFAVVVPGLPGEGAALAAGRALLVALTAPLDLPGVSVGASVGVSVWPDHVPDAEGLLRSADAAMYHVKLRGKNGVQLFSLELAAESRARQDTERHLRGALARGEFRLHYQPQCGPRGEVVGAEALLRWTHPELGEVPPARFIPVAEDLGLIVPLGEWVLREACRQAATWRAQGLPLRMAVNVSPAQFAQADFPGRVLAALREAGLPAEALELEITERLAVSDMAQTARQLGALSARGVRISIDDFGTGHSALAYLPRLPISGLKVDRSFVRDLDEGGRDEAGAARVVRAVAGLAHGLGLTVVAEGVEEPWQRERVHSLGCDLVQGFLLARPLPPAEFERWWQAHEARRGTRTGTSSVPTGALA